MRRMQSANVLIVGMRGLGVETAKNVILAGVRSVAIWDPEAVEMGDLAAQYYLTEEDVGRRRDECSVARLAELNTYVPVRILEVAGTDLQPERDLADFQVVVVTETALATQLALNDFTHATGRAFIAADVRGLFGAVFCDFGAEFVVTDATGEQPVTGMISAITQETDSVVTCLEDQRHSLEDGDVVRFREVRGMVELNGADVLRPVKVLSPFTFSIGDTSQLSAYETGGVFEQVKQPRRLSFKPLRESLAAPEFVISDFAKMERMEQLHVAFAVLGGMKRVDWPRPRNAADAEAFVERAKEYAVATGKDIVVDEALLRVFAQQCRGYLAPMCAVIGGLVAQEVLKACSGKFGPIRQHFYFDSLESLPVDLSPVETDFVATGSRYDAQIAVFGRAFQRRIEAARGFIVGSGAIGCELVKLYALMGVAGGDSTRTEHTERVGQLTLTDMDNIEKSNLNRQFLFRSGDVGKPKSLTAADAAFRINPAVRIDARVDRVGPETEHIFSADFFESLDFVTNALDNVDARKYMDQRCVFYCRPLLESGTLGTKGNTQVVIPHLTESYASSQDPPEKTIPFCTLHNFPNTIEHTIEWAMDFFSGTFRADPEAGNRFLQHWHETVSVGDSHATEAAIPPEFLTQRDRLEAVRRNLVEDVPGCFADCVRWACLRFQELFSSTIRQLLFNFPRDSMTSSGTPFWSGPKRAPTPIDFDPSNEMHLDFVVAGAHLRAQMYGIAGDKGADREDLRRMAETVEFPAFTPRSGVKIAQTDAEAGGQQASAGHSQPATPSDGTDELVQDIVAKFDVTRVPNVLLPHEFEKDDDSNRHIDFVTACANLRATNYEITPADRHHVKLIAGKIIPAIATTTALVSGLVALELYKVLDAPPSFARGAGMLGTGDAETSRYWNLDRFKNGFVNLALPFFAFSSPLPAPRLSFNGGRSHFTLWDSFVLHLSLVPNLTALLAKLDGEHGLAVTMLSSGSSLLFSSFLPKSATPERKALSLDQLVATVSKRAIPEHCDVLVLEALCEDAAGNDVEVPYIKLYLKK